MADNSVFISGVAEGAFTASSFDLPPWATEDTLEKISTTLENTYKLQLKSFGDMLKKSVAGSLSPDELKEANDELGKWSKHIKDQNAEGVKEKKRWKDRDDEHKKKQKDDKQESGAINLLKAAFVEAGQIIKQTMVANVSSFDQLYQSGINVLDGFNNVSDGFEALRQISVLTNVRYTELIGTIQKFSSVINAVGLGKFTKTLAATETSLSKFGYSNVEAADLLGRYLETQQGFTDVTSKTQQEVQKGLLQFGEKMTRLSQATGIMRQKLLEDVDAISQSVEANILSGQVGSDAAQSTLDFIATFKDKNLGQAFLRMMTDAIKPLNTTFMDFQKTGFGGFGQKLMAFTQQLEGVTDPAEKARLTAEFSKANQGELQFMLQRANLLRQAGVKEAEGVASTVTGILQYGRNFKEVNAQKQQEADATEKSAKDLANAYEELKAQPQKLFGVTTEMLNGFTSVVNGVNDFINNLARLVLDFQDWINKFDIIKNTFGNIQILPWAGLGIVILSTINGFRLLFPILKLFGDTISFSAGLISTIAKGIFAVGKGAIELLANGLMRVGSLFLELINPITKLAAAFAVGYGIGTIIYDIVSHFNWFNTMMDKIFSFLQPTINTIGTLFNKLEDITSKLVPGFVKNLFGGSKPKEEKVKSTTETVANNQKRVDESIKMHISSLPVLTSPLTTVNPTEPKASTLDSPSAVSTNPEVGGEKAPQKEASKPTGTGIEKPIPNAGINTLIGYQNSLIEQLLQRTSDLVSVNKDILKYTRVSA